MAHGGGAGGSGKWQKVFLVEFVLANSDSPKIWSKNVGKNWLQIIEWNPEHHKFVKYDCYLDFEFHQIFDRKYTNWRAPHDRKLKCKYSESRLMYSLANVINRWMWSHLNVPYTNGY